MENASKALIMASGVILTILIISLLIFAWTKFSDFYSSQDELRYIEDTAKFNEQFAAYDRNKLSGYELVSLANRISDYNFRFSNSEDAKNNINGNPIEMKIDFIDKANIDDLSFDYVVAGDNNYWFFDHTKTEVSTSGAKNFIQLLEYAQEIEMIYSNNPEITARVAKAIDRIIPQRASELHDTYGKPWDDLTSAEQEGVKEYCRKYYNSIAGTKYDSYSDIETQLGYNAQKIYKYYEYYKFKLQKFSCSDFRYDNQGRVNYIEFRLIK